MKVHFLEAEGSEEDFFLEALGEDHQIVFNSGIEEVEEDAEIVSCFIYSRIDRGFLSKHPALRMVATRSTTYDHIDFVACKEAGVTVCTVASYGDYTVAEHTFALLLALTRRLRPILNAQAHFSYEALRGTELRFKKLGVFGTGRIGMHVIPIAKAFGMEVIAHDPKPNHAAARKLGFSYVSFDELLSQSDVLTLHASLTPQTYHCFDREAFSRCKPGVLIINTARGALIDTESLLWGLKNEVIGGAGLDVLEDETAMRKEAINVISEQIIERMHHDFATEEYRMRDPQRIKQLQDLVRNKELLARMDVVFTPHVAFNSQEAVERINQTTVASIRAFASGRPVHALVSAGDAGSGA